MSFKISFLPYPVKEWNKLDPKIRNAQTYASFRKMLRNFIIPKGNSTYKIYDPLGIKLLTRLQLGFSHLSQHKFRHNFTDSLNPLCSCSLETESNFIFFYAAKIILLFAEPLRLIQKISMKPLCL